jgi:adenine deaminase
VHGTVATVSDPDEIANVLGLAGVEFMIDNAAQTPFKIAFGFPACVPATEFETAGAKLTVNDLRQLFADGISYLSEVMNVPGVLADSPDMMDKIHLAQSLGLPIDGHAPGLSGTGLRKYMDAKITTDHECSTLNEAVEKLTLGMKIQIREGSAAKNFDALHSLIDSYPEQCMFCSDDKHPDDLVNGHINLLVKRAVALGHDVMNVLQIACVNPVKHYNLDVGLLQVGDSADLIVVDKYPLNISGKELFRHP